MLTKTIRFRGGGNAVNESAPMGGTDERATRPLSTSVSRHRIPLLALRIEDVEPSDAFAYELSTRQWTALTHIPSTGREHKRTQNA